MQREMTPPRVAVSPATKGNVLVIDDEADIREGLEMLLISEGYKLAFLVMLALTWDSYHGGLVGSFGIAVAEKFDTPFLFLHVFIAFY